MFLSTFEKQLDAKRRIVVPQEFRAAVGRPVRRRVLLPLHRGRLHRGRRQGPVRPLRRRDRGAGVRRPAAHARWRPRSCGGMAQLVLRHRRPHHPARDPLRAVRPDRLGGGGGPGRPLPDLGARRLPGAPRRPARRRPRGPGRPARPAARRAARGRPDERQRRTSPSCWTRCVEALQPGAGPDRWSTAPSAPAATAAPSWRRRRASSPSTATPPPRRFADGLAAPTASAWSRRRFSEMDDGAGRGGASTAWRSTSASPPCSSTRPSAASPSCATARWTCAWAPTGPTAADLVNDRRAGRAGPHLLRLRRGARRAAASPRAIVRRRAEQPFTRTLELAEFVEKAAGRPPRRQDPSGHPRRSRRCASR